MQEQTQRTDLTPTPPPKRLHRSADSRMVLGVCGGLGEYFDVDPTIIRALFAVGVLLGGSTLLVYVVLAIIMPASEMIDADPRAAARGTLDETSAELRRGLGWAKDHMPGRKK